MRAPKLGTGARVAHEALALVGTPFVLGARAPGYGIDCMGVAVLAHRRAGLEVTDPRNYRRMAVQSRADMALYRRCFRRVRREDAAPGDLLLFDAGDQAHQAIVVEASAEGIVVVQADDRAAVDRVVVVPLAEDDRVRAVYRHKAIA